MIVSRNELIAACEAVKGAVPAKSLTPILTHVLIENQAVTGFDSEIGIKVKLPKPLGITFNARFETLMGLLRTLSGDEIDLEVDGAKVHLRCGRHKSTLLQIQEAYPKPQVSPGSWVTVASGLKEAMERTLIAVSERPGGGPLTCVMIDGAHVTALDGKQAVRCSVEGMDLKPMLLARKAVSEIVRLGQPMRLANEGPWALFDYGNLVLLARQMEGAADFPKLNDLIATLNLEQRKSNPIPDGFSAALSRLQLFCGDQSRAVTIKPAALGSEMTAVDATGDALEICEAFSGLPRSKMFNPHLLATALPFAETIAWGESDKDPIYLRGQTSNFEFLLSPMS